MPNKWFGFFKTEKSFCSCNFWKPVSKGDRKRKYRFLFRIHIDGDFFFLNQFYVLPHPEYVLVLAIWWEKERVDVYLQKVEPFHLTTIPKDWRPVNSTQFYQEHGCSSSTRRKHLHKQSFMANWGNQNLHKISYNKRIRDLLHICKNDKLNSTMIRSHSSQNNTILYYPRIIYVVKIHPQLR